MDSDIVFKTWKMFFDNSFKPNLYIECLKVKVVGQHGKSATLTRKVTHIECAQTMKKHNFGNMFKPNLYIECLEVNVLGQHGMWHSAQAMKNMFSKIFSNRIYTPNVCKLRWLGDMERAPPSQGKWQSAQTMKLETRRTKLTNYVLTDKLELARIGLMSKPRNTTTQKTN